MWQSECIYIFQSNRIETKCEITAKTFKVEVFHMTKKERGRENNSFMLVKLVLSCDKKKSKHSSMSLVCELLQLVGCYCSILLEASNHTLR